MKSPVRPELPTASVGSSQAPTAAVDNSAPSAIRPESTYKPGKAVQTNGATSQFLEHGRVAVRLIVLLIAHVRHDHQAAFGQAPQLPLDDARAGAHQSDQFGRKKTAPRLAEQ